MRSRQWRGGVAVTYEALVMMANSGTESFDLRLNSRAIDHFQIATAV
jgi:hypothetical protein